MLKRLTNIIDRSLTLSTHKVRTLPILILMPHSRCNCRCVMCDIWKANKHKQELTIEDLEGHIDHFKKLGVEQVVFSGGEALMHSNFWLLCKLLKEISVKITLLSTGLLLKKNKEEVLKWCDEVIVSLDGSSTVHNEIRNLPNAFEQLREGVRAIKAIAPKFPIMGRCVLQRLNFADLPNIIESAQEIGLDKISFLAADVSTSAFNRPKPLPNERVAEIALSPNEVEAFQEVLNQVSIDFAKAFNTGFIMESREKLNAIVQYYGGLNGQNTFPKVHCNAPWVSSVIEVNGDVLPCFFHPKLGNIYESPFDTIINSPQAIEFRKSLNVAENPICQKCVCSLNLKPTQALV